MVNNIFQKSSLLFLIGSLTLVACNDDNNGGNSLGELEEEESQFGKANDVFTAAEWYPGGELGTTEKASYSAIAPGAELLGLETSFNKGEDYFEHLYTYTDEPRKGLGPAWVRSSCIHCHPSYGHGKRQTEYKANTIGNGYLLVVYHPNEQFQPTNCSFFITPTRLSPRTVCATRLLRPVTLPR